MPFEWIGYGLAVFMGSTLGLVGSSGSILALPILVYFFHLSPVHATTYAMVIVGLTSIVGVVRYHFRGKILYRAGLLIALPASISVYVMRRFVLPQLPNPIIRVGDLLVSKGDFVLILVSVLMVAAAYFMLRHKKITEDPPPLTRGGMVKVACVGLATGVITGFVGAGAGFLILPVMIGIMGIKMRQAVGTSLLITPINSLVGFIGDMGSEATIFHNDLLFKFTACSFLGMIIGTTFSAAVSSDALKKLFAWGIFSLSVSIMTHQFLIYPNLLITERCFLIKEGNKILHREGNCQKRYSPCSTFKIPLSLIAFNEGVLTDTHAPQWSCGDKCDSVQKHCLGDQTPETWVKHNCLWYSEKIIDKVGAPKVQKYIELFKYGNRNLSGGIQKDDHAWLSSTLAISPNEQLKFLKKLSSHQLPVSLKAQGYAQQLLYLGELKDGWHLFGKTGSGYAHNKEDGFDRKRYAGWFVGWLAKDNRRILFAHYEVDPYTITSSAGPRVREETKERLKELLFKIV